MSVLPSAAARARPARRGAPSTSLDACMRVKFFIPPLSMSVTNLVLGSLVSSTLERRCSQGRTLLPGMITRNFFNAKAVEEVRRKNEVAGWELANQFKTLVATCRPEVEVEILVVEGDKGPTIVAQAKKLEASILVIGQRKPSVLWRLLKKKKDSLAEYCINNSDCLTLAVRKKSRRLGGYLINSQWQKNFWLLA